MHDEDPSAHYDLGPSESRLPHRTWRFNGCTTLSGAWSQSDFEARSCLKHKFFRIMSVRHCSFRLIFVESEAKRSDPASDDSCDQPVAPTLPGSTKMPGRELSVTNCSKRIKGFPLDGTKTGY